MSTLCQCCFSDFEEHQPVNNQGRLLVYMKMFQYCFGIQLVESSKSIYICNICVCKLRECCIFKNQVEETQWRLSMKTFSDDYIEKELTFVDTSFIKIEPEIKISCENSKNKRKPESKQELECKKCTKTFNDNGKFNNRCEYCDKIFENKKKLIKHRSNHENKIQCEVCSRFVHKYDLKKHQKQHKGEPIHSCSKCSRKFKDYYQKQRHMTESHGAEPKIYPCEACMRTFNTPRHRNIHFRKDHLKETKYSCTVCNKNFFLKYVLDRHMLVHTGEKKFECDICNKKFGEKHTLEQHLRIHYNIKNHSCDVCGCAFTQKGGLTEHLKKHTNKLITKII